MVGTVVDTRIQTTRQHARVEAVDRRTQWHVRIADQIIAGTGIDGIPALQRRGQTHINVNMRAAHNRADDAVDSGFHAIDRQLKTAGEIIAGTRRHNAQRFTGTAHGIGSKRNHAVAADRHQVVVFVPAIPGIRQGIVEALAGHVDHVEATLAPGLLQQLNHLLADLGTLAFV